jgi:hypothetical protein
MVEKHVSFRNCHRFKISKLSSRRSETQIIALPLARFRLARDSGQTAFLRGRASLINLQKKQSNAIFLSDTGETPKRQIGVSF